jgi:kynurenine formamidase
LTKKSRHLGCERFARGDTEIDSLQIEALNLEDLSRNRIFEFVFVASPLKIRGGTGSPIRPLALA